MYFPVLAASSAQGPEHSAQSLGPSAQGLFVDQSRQDSTHLASGWVVVWVSVA